MMGTPSHHTLAGDSLPFFGDAKETGRRDRIDIEPKKTASRTYTAFFSPPLFRLLLWDCDDRSYSYYVEVSTNQQQWTMVADRTKVSCK